MYVTDEELDTIAELSALVDGALESAEDAEYWSGLSKRTDALQRKMLSQKERQFNAKIKKICQRIAKRR